MSPQTLNELLAKHPEYGDLPVGVFQSDGSLDMFGIGAGSAYVYEADEQEIADGCEPGKVLVISGN